MLYNLLLVLLVMFALVSIVQSMLIIFLTSRKPKQAPKPRKITRKKKQAIERKASDKELKKYQTILENIDAYDGTNAGQKEL